MAKPIDIGTTESAKLKRKDGLNLF